LTFPGAIQRYKQLLQWFGRIPHDLIASLGRFSIAAVFWQSGQTKVEGLAINIVNWEFMLGWPRLSDTVIPLFQQEYRLPLISPVWGAYLSATAEHVFALLILLGLATRLSALALLGMTLVIEIFVFPGAYPTHGVWATVLLYLMASGPGRWSVDHAIACRWGG